ncbi:MAG: Fur family transcriptional regulator [Treponema sp.]
MEKNYFMQIAEAGIRPSVQRVAIFQYVSEHHTHPTVDTIYSELFPKYPTLSRTTVYNTLKLFAEHGLVQTIQIEEDKLRYDANTAPHIHFKCIKCGAVSDVFGKERLSSINSDCCSMLPPDVIACKVQTYIWGICKNCLQLKTQK